MESSEQDESILIAKRMISLFPPYSAMFTTCTRSVRNAILAGTPEEIIKSIAVNSSSFVVQVSPSLKALFFTAAQKIYPTKLKTRGKIQIEELLGVFTADEIVSLLTVTYLYRQVAKRMPPAEWERLAPKVHLHLELGALVGSTINYVGSGYGMLLAGIRPLSTALFALVDLKGYQDVRRKTDKAGVMYDMELENSKWNCNHMLIAATILQSAGIGSPLTTAFTFNHGSAKYNQLPESQRDPVYCLGACMQMVESLQISGRLPENISGIKSELAMPDEETSRLENAAQEINSAGRGYDWIGIKGTNLDADAKEQLGISADGQRSNDTSFKTLIENIEGQ